MTLQSICSRLLTKVPSDSCSPLLPNTFFTSPLSLPVRLLRFTSPFCFFLHSLVHFLPTPPFTALFLCRSSFYVFRSTHTPLASSPCIPSSSSPLGSLVLFIQLKSFVPLFFCSFVTLFVSSSCPLICPPLLCVTPGC